MIQLKYYNPVYQIALSNWQMVYQLPQGILMYKEVHQGSLYYRCPGSSKRIRYQQLKKGLIQKITFINEPVLPF
jgi:hypothetical protein